MIETTSSDPSTLEGANNMDEKKNELTNESQDCLELDDDALEMTTGGMSFCYGSCPRCGKTISNIKCPYCGAILS